MVIGKNNPPLSRSELNRWWAAFLVGAGAHQLKGGTRRHPAGTAHQAAEFADSAIVEYRLRKNGGAS